MNVKVETIDRPQLAENQTLIWQPDALPSDPIPVHGIQHEFLSSTEDLVDLDGGKGSGKTDILFFDHLVPQHYNNADYHGVIFRRENKRLLEIIGRAQKWMSRMNQLHAHWQGDKTQQRYIFPSGAWIGFHSCENAGDEEKYQGWEITKLSFDQLEEFLRSQFYYLLNQNRTSNPHLKATCRWTANPGGIGHGWVKKDFIDEKIPFTRKTDGKIYRIESEVNRRKVWLDYKRIFGDVFDNPVYRTDDKYLAKLAGNPNPYQRKMFLEGDWSVVIGQFFIEYLNRIHMIPSVPLPKRWNRIGGLDYGNVKTIEFLCADYEENIFCEWEFRSSPDDDNPNGMTATPFAEASAKWMLEHGIGEGLIIVGDINMWTAPGKDVGTNKTPAAIIRRIWKQRFEEKGKKPPVLVKVRKRGTDDYAWRVACNEAVRDGLGYAVDKQGRLVRAPKIHFFDRCASINNTLPSLIADKNDPRDIADHQDDHDYDAFKQAYMRLVRTLHPTPKDVKEWYEELAEQGRASTEDESAAVEAEEDLY